jgi:TatD DNase family protein
VLRVLDEEGAPERVVFHCFSGDAAMARLCADAGYYLSFGGPVTFKPNDELRAAAAVCPADRILVETDAPFLTPMPFRGRPNAPYLVPLTVRALAAARGQDLDELCAAIAANGRRAFGL